MNGHIGMETADEIVLASAYADLVDDCEIGPRGYVYTLDDGRVALVTFAGELVMLSGDEAE